MISKRLLLAGAIGLAASAAASAQEGAPVTGWVDATLIGITYEVENIGDNTFAVNPGRSSLSCTFGKTETATIIVDKEPVVETLLDATGSASVSVPNGLRGPYFNGLYMDEADDRGPTATVSGHAVVGDRSAYTLSISAGAGGFAASDQVVVPPNSESSAAGGTQPPPAIDNPRIRSQSDAPIPVTVHGDGERLTISGSLRFGGINNADITTVSFTASYRREPLIGFTPFPDPEGQVRGGVSPYVASTVIVGEVVGEAEAILPNGTTVVLSGGEVLTRDMRIYTGIESSCQLIWPDDSRVIVQELTDVRITALEAGAGSVKTRLWLKAGEIDAEVVPRSGLVPDFRIRTPTATLGVRGTSLRVAHQEQPAAVSGMEVTQHGPVRIESLSDTDELAGLVFAGGSVQIGGSGTGISGDYEPLQPPKLIGYALDVLAEIENPLGLSLAADGNLYALGSLTEPIAAPGPPGNGAGDVVRIAGNGTATWVATLFPGGEALTGPAIGSGGKVYGAHADEDAVFVSTTGDPEDPVTYEAFAVGLNAPSGVVTDAAGTVFCANGGSGEILKFDATGQPTAIAVGLDDPTLLAFDAASNSLIFAQRGPERLSRVSASGGATSLIATDLGFVPSAAAVLPGGDLVVADAGTGELGEARIRRVDANSGTATIIGLRFSVVRGLAADGAGNIYIAEAVDSKVYKATPFGVPGGQIDVESLVLDFNAETFGTNLGVPDDLTFKVSNCGLGALNVSSSAFSDGAFSLVSPALPLTIPPQSSQDFTLRFAPTATGAVEELLTLNSDDSQWPTVDVRLHGIGQIPLLSPLGSGIPGAPLRINGVGFGPMPADNIVRIGDRVVPVESVGESCAMDKCGPTHLDVTMPLDLFGELPVTVSYGGFTSNPETVTIGRDGVSLEPQILEFGEVLVGATADASAFFGNNSGETVNVTAITFPDPDFSLVSPALPFNVPSGTSVEATIRFAPSSAGSHTTNATATYTGAGGGALGLFPTGFGAVAGASVLYLEDFESSSFNTLPSGWSVDTGSSGFNGTLDVRATSGNPGRGCLLSASVSSGSAAQGDSYHLSATSPTIAGPFPSGDLSKYQISVDLRGTDPALVHKISIESTSTTLFWPGDRIEFMVPTPNGFVYDTFSALLSEGTMIGTYDPTLPHHRITISADESLWGFGFSTKQGIFDNLRLDLLGESTVTGFTATPANLGFGSVDVGSSSALSVVLTNTGDVPISITSVAIDDPAFTLVSPNVPFALPVGGSVDATLRFSPAAAGAASGNAVFNADGGAEAQTVMLSGTGLQTGGGDPAEDWRQAQFGADAGNPAIAGDGSDPDEDSGKNVLERFSGGNPLVPDTSFLPEVVTTEIPGIAFIFRLKLDERMTDLRGTVQTSPDGRTWSDGVVFTPLGAGGGFSQVDSGSSALMSESQNGNLWMIDVAVMGDADLRKFARLMVGSPGGGGGGAQTIFFEDFEEPLNARGWVGSRGANGFAPQPSFSLLNAAGNPGDGLRFIADARNGSDAEGDSYFITLISPTIQGPLPTDDLALLRLTADARDADPSNTFRLRIESSTSENFASVSGLMQFTTGAPAAFGQVGGLLSTATPVNAYNPLAPFHRVIITLNHNNWGFDLNSADFDNIKLESLAP